MKTLIKIILAILVLFFIFIGVILAFANPILEHFKPQAEAMLSKKLNSEVSIGKVSLNIIPNTAIRLNDVQLKNKDGKALKVGYFLVDTSLLKLLQKQITVNSVVVADTDVEITRAKDNSILVNNIDFKKELASPSANEKPSQPADESSEPANYDIQITKVELKNINILFIDEQVSPKQEISISIDDIVLDEIVLQQLQSNFSAAIGLFSKKGVNLSFSGGTALNAKAPLNSTLSLNASYNNVDVAKLLTVARAYGVDLSALPLDDALAAKIKLNYPGDFNKTSLNLDLILKGAPKTNIAATFKPITNAINVASDIVFKDTPLTLNANVSSDFITKARMYEGKVKVFDGNIAFDANYGLKNKAFDLDVTGKGINVAKMYKFALPQQKDVTFSGEVTEAEVKMRGNAGNLKPSLNGFANLFLIDGSIEGINILAQSLNVALKVPGFTDTLVKFLPERYSGLMSNERTVFKTLEFKSNVAEQRVNITDFIIKHSEFTMEAKGNVAFAGNIVMQARLLLTQDASDHIIKKNAKLKWLLNDAGIVEIPLVISKNETGKVMVVPDTAELVKRASQGFISDKSKVITEKVNTQLDKLSNKLGGKKNPEGEAANGAIGTTSTEKPASKLGSALGEIFKK